MLHGPLTGKLLLFTLPIALSSMVQQLFNAADTAVVGYFGSESALAAVGTNTEMIALIVTVSSGLSIGANILIAHSIGRNQTKGLPDMLRTAMLLAALFSTIGLLIGQITASPSPPIFPLCFRHLWCCAVWQTIKSFGLHYADQDYLHASWATF